MRSLAYTLTFMGVGALVATLTGSAAATGVIVDQAATLLMPSSELGSTVLGGAALAGVDESRAKGIAGFRQLVRGPDWLAAVAGYAD